MGFIKNSLPQPHSDLNVKPIAILSGEIIHIIYPNGEVEATTQDAINHHKTRYSLQNC